MKTSESIVKISAALLAAQKKIGAAKKGADNPYFHSKYADLGSVMEVCKDALNENGILVLQPAGHDSIGDYVETVLIHAASGEFISDAMRYHPGTKPQEQGSAVTYARRYSLQSMLFIPSEDDDGNSSSGKTVTVPATQRPVGVQTTIPTVATPAQKTWIRDGIAKGRLTIDPNTVDKLSFQEAADLISSMRKDTGK